jgi:YesN/AraC family two-component response regulator
MNITNYQSKFIISAERVSLTFEELSNFSSRMSQTSWFQKILYTNRQFDPYSDSAPFLMHTYNEELKTYVLLSDIIDAIIIYYPQRNYILSSFGLLYQEKMPQKLFYIADFNDAEWKNIIGRRNIEKIISGLSVTSTAGGNSKGLIYLNTYPFGSDMEPRANLLLYVREESIYSRIDQELLENNCYFAVYYQNETILESGELLSDAVSFRIRKGFLEYFLQIDKGTLLSSSNTTIYLIMGILLVFFGCILSSFFSRLFYHPLKIILNRLGDYNFKQQNEFRRLEYEITNIIRTEKKLQDRLEMQRPVLVNAVLEQLISTISVPETEFRKLMELLDISFSYRYFQVILFLNVEKNQQTGIRAYLEQFAKDRILFFYLNTEQGLTLIANYDTVDKFEQITQVVDKMLAEVFSECLLCGAGEKYTDLYNISKSFSQACQAAEDAYYYGCNRLLLYIPRTNMEDMSILSPSRQIEKFEFLLREGESEDAKKYLIDMINTIEEKIKLFQIPPIQTKRLIIELWERIRQIADEFLMPQDLQFPGLKLSSFREDCDLLKNACIAIAAYIKATKKKIYNQHMQNIKVFIDKNLYNPQLSLDMIANEFNYTSAYVSRLLKDYFKKNFLEYVNENRIKKAKELLASTNWSINRVSRESGFYNDISFRRLFKKKSGLSPGKYRVLVQE